MCAAAPPAGRATGGCMPIGRPPRRGATYLLLLFLLALAGAALAQLGTQWQLAAQRDRELELLFRGQQISDALRRYQAATGAGQPAGPGTLDELLDDRRGPVPRHHLRRLFTDPFTGQADWLLLHDSSGAIVGLHSRSTQVALRSHRLPVAVISQRRAPTVGDWRFQIDSASSTAAAAPATPTAVP